MKHPSTPSTTSVKSAVGVLAESPTTWSFNFQQELFVCNRIGARGLESTDMGYGSSPGESLAPPPALFAKNWTGVRRFTCVVEEIAPNLVLPIAKPMRLSTLRLWLTSGPTENSVDGGVLSPPLWPRVAEKAGNCLDPEEERAKEQLEVWLAAWKINPERPRNQLLLVPSHGREPLSTEPTTWPDAADTRVGGGDRKPEHARSLGICSGGLFPGMWARLPGPAGWKSSTLGRASRHAALGRCADSPSPGDPCDAWLDPFLSPGLLQVGGREIRPVGIYLESWEEVTLSFSRRKKVLLERS